MINIYTVKPYPEISVIIPVFNCDSFLEDCLQSVLSQTFQNWECIVVDDGSADKSGEICDRFAGIDARFRVFHRPNRGVSSSRNYGLQNARGPLFCFIDADDWIDPDYLECMLAGMSGADLVVSGQCREYPDGHAKVLSPSRDGEFTIDAAHADEFMNLEKLLLLYAPHEKIFRSEILASGKIQFPHDCSNGEDLIFNFLYLDNVKNIQYRAFAKYHYRMNGTGLSSSFRPNQFEEDYSQWKLLMSFHDRHGLISHTAKEYLAQRLWGIVYDGLFLYPKIELKNGYIRSILSVPEISILDEYKTVFNCSGWIKYSIIHRLEIVFKIYFATQKRDRA